jgi:CRISPR-associated protein Cmr4
MYQTAKPLFFRTETPLHAGSGSDLGHIDLPIQREKHTDLPNIQSSGLKGAFRQNIEDNVTSSEDKIGVHLVFGYDKDIHDKNVQDKIENDKVKAFFAKPEDNDYSGSLAFTDARLLLFPIKSFKGVYALATCEMIITKFKKEINHICNLANSITATIKDVTSDRIAVANENFLKINEKVILEEYAFNIETEQNTEIAKLVNELNTLMGCDANSDITNRLVILPNDVFRDFTRLSTEVITRTKIDNATGTVQGGALFTEEYLPAESYLYTIVASSNVFQTKAGREKREKEHPNLKLSTDTEVMTFFKHKVKDVMQIGGSSTLGKGIVKLLNLKQL